MLTPGFCVVALMLFSGTDAQAGDRRNLRHDRDLVKLQVLKEEQEMTDQHLVQNKIDLSLTARRLGSDKDKSDCHDHDLYNHDHDHDRDKLSTSSSTKSGSKGSSSKHLSKGSHSSTDKHNSNSSNKGTHSPLDKHSRHSYLDDMIWRSMI